MAHKSRLDKNEFNSTFQFHGTLSIIFNTLDVFERCIIFLIWKMGIWNKCYKNMYYNWTMWRQRCTENKLKKYTQINVLEIISKSQINESIQMLVSKARSILNLRQTFYLSNLHSHFSLEFYTEFMKKLQQ